MDDKVDIGAEGLGGRTLFCNFFEHTLDEKNRLTIPADWRKLVGEPKRIFIMPAVGNRILRALSAAEADRRMEHLQKLSLSDSVAHNHLRILAARSDMVPWDTQGRIRLREDLMEYAGIKRHAVLVGSFNGFEIWSPEKWKEQQAALEKADLSVAVNYFNL